MIHNSVVFVIDDDESMRKSLHKLLDSANYQVELFDSAAEFLGREPHPGPSCLIVDVKMPGLNGIDLQRTLIQRRREEQLVFITGHGDIPMSVEAMKAGAVDFLAKPFKPWHLLECVENALAQSAEERDRAARRNEARALLDRLTPREFEVGQLLITGMLNKQVGAKLGMTEKTVKCHRGSLMHKLGITSVPELISIVQGAKSGPRTKAPTKVQ